MAGDPQDMRARLRVMLPARWFPDATPVLDGLLAGLAATWSALWDMLAFVRAQTRLATATADFLDLASRDYFGAALPRYPFESDDAFRQRIAREIRRPRATRPALEAALSDLPGRPPAIFEFTRPADTGSWNLALGYNAGGGWGTLGLPFQVLVTAYRPQGGSLATLSGWGSGAGGWGATANSGAIGYANPSLFQAPVDDAAIRAAIASVLPVAVTAWTRIED
jgi:hypothetical protein